MGAFPGSYCGGKPRTGGAGSNNATSRPIAVSDVTIRCFHSITTALSTPHADLIMTIKHVIIFPIIRYIAPCNYNSHLCCSNSFNSCPELPSQLPVSGPSRPGGGPAIPFDNFTSNHINKLNCTNVFGFFYPYPISGPYRQCHFSVPSYRGHIKS